jgi:hypothetical protein
VADAPAPAKGAPFVFADFGTADGGTSMPLLSQAIGAVRERLGPVEVEVRYEDQPFNEWKSLFNYTQGTERLPDVTPLGEAHENVFITASGTSFYQQCFPSDSVHVGMSFTAMHWLSELPCDLTSPLAVHSTQAKPEQKALFVAQSQTDWRSILKQRAEELVPGGRFVFVNFSETEEGYCLGGTDVGASMYDNFARLMRELVDDGTITEAEFAACTFPNHYRSAEETLRPFKENGGTFEGLKVVSCEERIVRCPYREELTDALARGEERDGAKYAEDFYATTRTWSNSTFLNALDAARPQAEREDIVERFFGMYKAEIAQDPGSHGMDYVHCYLVVEKAQ